MPCRIGRPLRHVFLLAFLRPNGAAPATRTGAFLRRIWIFLYCQPEFSRKLRNCAVIITHLYHLPKTSFDYRSLETFCSHRGKRQRLSCACFKVPSISNSNTRDMIHKIIRVTYIPRAMPMNDRAWKKRIHNDRVERRWAATSPLPIRFGITRVHSWKKRGLCPSTATWPLLTVCHTLRPICPDAVVFTWPNFIFICFSNTRWSAC